MMAAYLCVIYQLAMSGAQPHACQQPSTGWLACDCCLMSRSSLARNNDRLLNGGIVIVGRRHVESEVAKHHAAIMAAYLFGDNGALPAGVISMLPSRVIKALHAAS